VFLPFLTVDILSPYAGILVYMGYVCGILWVSRYIDPDADLLGMTESEGRLMREWKFTHNKVIQEVGGCIGFVVVWWMLPYAYIMKFFGGHRGLSHTHVLGTLTRVLWILWPVAFVWWWYYMPWAEFIIPFVCGITGGLIVTDSMHIYLDNRTPKRKRT
jgi:hypothetical protein